MPRSARPNKNDAHRALWCTLDVGSLKVSVYLVDRFKQPFRKTMVSDGGDAAVGVWLAEASMILIGWDLAPDLAEQTLLHEMAHADEYVSGHDHGEGVINAITACQYASLKRNGMLKFPTRPALPKGAQ